MGKESPTYRDPMSPASNAPRGFGVPKAISPIADVQGASKSGTTTQDNGIIGRAGQPASADARAKAIAKRLSSTINRAEDNRRGNA